MHIANDIIVGISLITRPLRTTSRQFSREALISRVTVRAKKSRCMRMWRTTTGGTLTIIFPKRKKNKTTGSMDGTSVASSAEVCHSDHTTGTCDAFLYSKQIFFFPVLRLQYRLQFVGCLKLSNTPTSFVFVSCVDVPVSLSICSKCRAVLHAKHCIYFPILKFYHRFQFAGYLDGKENEKHILKSKAKTIQLLFSKESGMSPADRGIQLP